MSKVETDLVVGFIKRYAKNGPEHISRNGQFSAELIKPAEYVTDRYDLDVCPGKDYALDIEAK